MFGQCYLKHRSFYLRDICILQKTKSIDQVSLYMNALCYSPIVATYIGGYTNLKQMSESLNRS